MLINRFTRLTILAVSALIPQVSTVFAQGTAFTYQGRLSDGATAASGVYDFEFNLWNESTAGSLVAGPVSYSSVPVSGGLFTVAIDFQANVFDGSPPWLEILVRTNGGGVFTTLSPRQQLTPSPYAMTAAKVTGPVPAGQVSGPLSAASLPGGGNWPLTSTLTIDAGTLSVDPANDWVGIGTSTPTAPLTVRPSNSFYGLEHTDGTRRLTTYLDPSGCWLGTISPHNLHFFVKNNAFPSLTLDVNGRLGIGTPNPVESLHILGGLGSARLDSTSNPNGSVLELRNTMASPNYFGAINFNDAGGTYPGQIGYLATHDLVFRTEHVERMRLDRSGRLDLQNSIRLGAADEPMIVRQWDPFTSGSKSGFGRWGLFMEPRTLFLGVPGTDYGSISSIAFGGWLSEGTRQDWMTIVEGGNVGVGTTAPADKLHVAGNLRVDGNINLAPRKVWVSMPANRFVPYVLDTSRGDTFIFLPSEAYVNSKWLQGSLPLDLPDHARFVQVLITCSDKSSQADLRYTLQAVNASSGSTIDLATAQSSGNGGIQSLTMNAFALPYVNNSVMCYSLFVDTVGGTPEDTGLFMFMPVRVQYEVTELP